MSNTMGLTIIAVAEVKRIYLLLSFVVFGSGAFGGL